MGARPDAIPNAISLDTSQILSQALHLRDIDMEQSAKVCALDLFVWQRDGWRCACTHPYVMQ